MSPNPSRAKSIVHDRPRERLRSVGARNLALRELLALIIGSGSAGSSAPVVAERITTLAEGSLRRLASMDVALLERIPGVGKATASRVLASLELGRRAASEDADPSGRIRGPADVFARMGPRLRDVPQEEFHALLLNSRHRVIREVLVTRGTLDSALIHAREVFRPAVAEGAAGVILVHNHPSGDPAPSEEDRSVTRQLALAGKALGIPVLDHVVVGRGSYTSLADVLLPGRALESRLQGPL
jgi:DNA repair protein RadC